ncbi:P-loop containing nucleoside triphosphate hydrolase protein [Apodospora peruviana]|uniref:P-loop containing nucleoside triphosphate hydrolase protein n=1 Tax=Apodospora peruviana TaxID=516989 RepID=A0AAE0HZZ8_9PEZI|nr:P-loop containing nucleoside triphosphate hydrolase protein [Apodospora peruviana]
MATVKRPMANLLALPSTLRYLVLRESIRHASTKTRSARSSPSHSAADPVLSFMPGPSNDPEPRALPSPNPANETLTSVDRLFTSEGQQLLWTAPRFFDIPYNNLVPEICILGRSNVGKSTLINALGGANGAIARRANGQSARKGGMAITSPTAGCTKLMNAYAFGPPTHGPVQIPKLPASPVSLIPSELTWDCMLRRIDPKPMSRKDRRNAKTKKPDAGIPAGLSMAERTALKYENHIHSLWRRPVPRSVIILDTPGYGLASQKSWGEELHKYLTRRVMLRGAVVLVDAVAGFKKVDRMAVEMLRDKNVRMTIVLTKADKVDYAPEKLNDVCLGVWDELRSIEGRRTGWTEGNGWEREIWVTGAGDMSRKNGANGAVSSNVSGARMAICKMAGLVTDDRREEIVTPEVAKPLTQGIISFEEIEAMMARAAADKQNNAKRGKGRRPLATF